jgi:aryl-alcohol dehydrogenase-like predicted oxidoreductase
MRFTPIPNTTLLPSALCLGAGGMGASIDRAEAYRMLDAFLDHGGNFLDTAKVYSDWIPGETSRSEKLLGAWMKARSNRNRVMIATKGAHPELSSMLVQRVSPAEITADLDSSLSSLQVDTIDLYWLHRDDPVRPVEEIVETLHAAAQAGKIRAYGCSNWSLDRIRAAQQYAAAHGMAGFSAVQNWWTLAKLNPDGIQKLDPTLQIMDEALWQYHRETHLAAIPYTSQANGLFQKLDAGRPISENMNRLYLNPTTEARYQRLKELRTQTGLSTTQIVIGYLTSQPFPTIPVVGPNSLAQLNDCLTAADTQLTMEQLAFLNNGSQD